MYHRTPTIQGQDRVASPLCPSTGVRWDEMLFALQGKEGEGRGMGWDLVHRGSVKGIREHKRSDVNGGQCGGMLCTWLCRVYVSVCMGTCRHVYTVGAYTCMWCARE